VALQVPWGPMREAPLSTSPAADVSGGSSPPPSRDLGNPVERSHASDQVFKEIARAILNRELAAGTPLPPERELSERFGVSRIVVREAIHRLKEYELVRVRQGSPTQVLDPDRATDIRLLGLEIELVPPTPEGMLAFAERQIYSGAALLDLSEQRMTSEEIDELERLVDEYAKGLNRDEDSLPFERAYWVAIGRGTRNRIYLREILWYFNLLERDPRFRSMLAADPESRVDLYRSVNAAHRQRSGSAAVYLNTLRALRERRLAAQTRP
jgi:GntR family transcriptional regulator, transcriptional repressor for pyruvate dehydrogenase complex